MLRFFWPVALVALASCASDDDSRDARPVSRGPLVVYAVNYPLQYFTERMGGQHVVAVLPAPPKLDPATWSPSAEDISRYQSADLILLNGARYARWTARVSLPSSKLVDTSSSFQDRLLVSEDTLVHSHGPDGEHSHGETAFTTWLDPTQAIEQARAIRDALAEARPEHADVFERGFDGLARDLEELDGQMERAFAASAGGLVASHPIYQYLARRYALNLPAVHFEPDVAPDAQARRELDELLAEHPATRMLWEDEPLEETADHLRERGIESVPFRTGANRPETGDYLSIMRSNVAALEAIQTRNPETP